MTDAVVPAQAGTEFCMRIDNAYNLDPRLRGDDGDPCKRRYYMLGPRPVRCSFSICSWHAVQVFFGAGLRILSDDD